MSRRTPIQMNVKPNSRSTALEVAEYFNADLTGKTAVVTGASSGIGLETCKVLAGRGCKVIMCCRDVSAGKKAVETEIKQAGVGGYVVSEPDVQIVQLDLADLVSVEAAAQEIQESTTSIDFLINNAGVMATPLEYTKQGFELQVGTNHYGHFHLTSQLLPLMRAQPRPARVVNLASVAHEQFGADFDVSDLHFRRGRRYSNWGAYGQSKLANVLFTRALHRRCLASPDAQISALAVHPGVIPTNLWRHTQGVLKWVVTKVVARFAYASNEAKSIPQGAATTVYACLAPELEGYRGGAYLADCKVCAPSDKAMDVKLAEKLWEVTERDIAAAMQPQERGQGVEVAQ